jgi:hypothetical protein
LSKRDKKSTERNLANLQTQVEGYEKAEITMLFAEKTKSGSYFNLLTLIELVPSEQAASLSIGTDKYPYVIRDNANDYTLYTIRIPEIPLDDALKMYAGASVGGITLNHKGVVAHVDFLGELADNPPGFQPLLVGNEERQLGRLLPHRHTSSRIWSQLNMDKSWLEGFNGQFFRKVSELSKKLIGHDLSLIPEHIGNVYLFGCNPLVRSWECRLADYDKDLLLLFRERTDRSITGSKLILEEVRGGNNGFYIEHTLSAANTRITLPYFPDKLHIRLFDPKGHWIDHQFSGWVNFVVDIAFHDRVVNYVVNSAIGTQVLSVPKKSSERSISVGSYDWTAAHYLQAALAARRFHDLAKSKEFVFFPKDPDSINRAKETVRELLNSARKRCMILDPYFGVSDMIYVYQIENISLVAQIISSADHLNERPRQGIASVQKGWRGWWQRFKSYWCRRPVNTAKTYLESLFDEIVAYQKVMPQQRIECRVLRGSPSPLHDRFLVIDDNVYLLGSSLNEFGNRTTTIIRVPTPEELINQAINWWKDDEHCPAIADYVTERKAQYV